MRAEDLDAQIAAHVAAQIQPVVLVGGRSRRFGRDKLREPWGDAGKVLVERPIEALRRVFGRRVKVVGACDPHVVQLADGEMTDAHPGIGPIGGIVSALGAWSGPVFVLAGDMPGFQEHDVRRVVHAWQGSAAEVLAVLAASHEQVHPCAGVYTQRALQPIVARIAAGEFRLSSALDPTHVVRVECGASAVANVNEPWDVATASGALNPARPQSQAPQPRPGSEPR